MTAIAAHPATALFSVHVTKDDVERGQRGLANRCPVAIALRRLFPASFSVRVTAFDDAQTFGLRWSASIQSFKGSLSFNIPEDVVERINSFDGDGKMEPFTWHIMI